MQRQIGGADDTNKQFLVDWMNKQISGWNLNPQELPDTRIFYQILVHDDAKVELISAVALNRWTPYTCEIHIATDKTKRWANRKYIYTVYDYIFNTCGLTRINALVHQDNEDAINLHRRLGHTEEGRLRHEFGPNEDAIVFGFTFEDWAVSRFNKPSLSTTEP